MLPAFLVCYIQNLFGYGLFLIGTSLKEHLAEDLIPSSVSKSQFTI